jgi:hypothetical protein
MAAFPHRRAALAARRQAPEGLARSGRSPLVPDGREIPEDETKELKEEKEHLSAMLAFLSET